MLLSAPSNWITKDFYFLALHTGIKVRQKQISTSGGVPCLPFRWRLLARANDFGEEVIENIDASPWNLPYEALLPALRSANNDIKPANLTPTNKQELGLVVDAALEEDYGLLKEKIQEDKRIQLVRKQDSDVESTADTIKLLKRSKVIAKQVISQSSARLIGFVSQVWVSVRLFQVVALEVRPSLLSGEFDRVFLADVRQIGDVVLIDDENSLENQMTAVDCETLVGYDVVTEDGSYIGKIRDYSFDLQDGKLSSFDFDAVGFSIVPSSLISTYRLDAEEVREVLMDSILVKAGVESRIRRLTKGFWQLPLAGQKRRQIMSKSKLRRREFGRQARSLPSGTRPWFSEGADMEGSGVGEEPPECDSLDWPPQSRVR